MALCNLSLCSILSSTNDAQSHSVLIKALSTLKLLSKSDKLKILGKVTGYTYHSFVILCTCTCTFKFNAGLIVHNFTVSKILF